MQKTIKIIKEQKNKNKSLDKQLHSKEILELITFKIILISKPYKSKGINDN